jgi:hypothetical protein
VPGKWKNGLLKLETLGTFLAYSYFLLLSVVVAVIPELQTFVTHIASMATENQQTF